MSNSNYDIGYLKRYVRGELSPREMHAIELEAQQDPLLADILMGIENDPETDRLPELRYRIQNRIESDNSKATPIRKIWKWNTWAAAAALLVAIGSALVYYFNQHETAIQPHLAQQQQHKNTPPTVAEKQTPSPIGQSDTVPQSNNERANRTTTKAEIADTKNTRTKTVPSILPPIQLDTTRMLASTALRGRAAAETSANMPGARRISISKPEIQGTVTDSQTGDPLAGVVVAQRNGKINVHTDKSGQFSLTPLSSDSLLDIYTPGYERKTLNYLTKNNIHVKLSPMQQELQGTVAGVAINKKTEPAEPLWGWKAFNNYIKEKTRKSKEMGFVELAFYIDDAGYPIDIEVLQSGGAQLDTLAKQILLAGPKWSRSPEKVIVPFEFGK